METERKLEHYFKSGHPAIVLQSWEERRATLVVKRACQSAGFKLYTWSCITGVVDTDTKKTVKVKDELGQDDTTMAAVFPKLPNKSVVLCLDIHMDLRDAGMTQVRSFKDMFEFGKSTNKVIIIHGCRVKLPPELEKECIWMDLQLPDAAMMEMVIRNVASGVEGVAVPRGADMDKCVDAALGMTTSEAEDAISLSIVECGEVNARILAREKAGAVRKSGILELIDTEAGLSEIGGYHQLVRWFKSRKPAFSKEARTYGLPVPKGVLLLGIPGTGKTLGARAIAKEYGVPLIKLNGGRIFGGIVGESEANMRQAIQTAEAVAPCVLLIDELGYLGSIAA